MMGNRATRNPPPSNAHPWVVESDSPAETRMPSRKARDSQKRGMGN
jgi:hypothetical protein